ncbi:hypothetical protein L6164_029583 [Bauhinia variegata]|uniref:Uncharacterized protein n=1 Tax=Bauhinia variegata TaxID=167791 RepID=A0ACB9LA63_BAUVA|nr:hypothetical protein L6164_029583 [Bauhinia variegata]
MALQEELLDKFERQQERFQTILTSIAAYKKAQLANARAPAVAVKFSKDTERLQLINSIRKAPLGAQIKHVINLLRERKQVLILEQITEASYVDLKPNKAVFYSLKYNPKVNYDGKGISNKPKHDVKDVELIRSPDGIAIGNRNVMRICSNGKDSRHVLQAKAKEEPGNQQKDQTDKCSSSRAYRNR